LLQQSSQQFYQINPNKFLYKTQPSDGCVFSLLLGKRIFGFKVEVDKKRGKHGIRIFMIRVSIVAESCNAYYYVRKVNNMLKLIAIDLDGTLLNEGHQISEENIKAIRQAEQQGIEVVIATGRSYFDAHAICGKVGLANYIISCNGASIHSREGQQISAIKMEKHDVEHIMKWLEDRNFYYEVSTNNGIYAPCAGRGILELELEELKGTSSEKNVVDLQKLIELMYGQLGMVFVNQYQEFISQEDVFYKILACSFDEVKRKNGVEQFKGMKQLSMASSTDSNFELVSQKASKGNALEMLAAQLKIPFDQVMAIGDSPNDISMLERVKYSVAMGNAKEEIKALCNFVTHTNGKNGVAHAIYQAIDANVN